MGKKKRKKIKIKVEDYCNNGIFELARFGNVVSLRNISSPEQHAKIMEYCKNEYPKVKERIDKKVSKIRKEVSLCNPWILLKFAHDMSLLPQMNKFSEIEYTKDENTLIREIDYIQSILVSTENHFDANESDEQQEERFHAVLADISNLYEEFFYFYNFWAAHICATQEISIDMVNYIVESQMLYLVRGNRYQIFQLEPLKQLLPPHNDVLEELFGTTADQIITGLTKLEYAMSQGVGDAWMAMGQKYEEFCKSVFEGADPETAIEADQEALTPVFNKIFGDGLNNILGITGWDERLINALTLGIGECDSFYTEKEFSGWPIMEMPTKRKPFIRIDGVVYGFDYYTLFDNFYRTIQKEIFRAKPEYINIWNHRQNMASEEMVKALFLKLLPGATAYNGNYYPVGNSTKQMNENDIIITYENYLFIIEVKAGSFPLTPPITDFEAHIKAYTKLAQEADSQSSRTLKYIETHEVAHFYAENGQDKFVINAKTFDDIFSFSVTVDNFNAFAAKAEKLNFITLTSKTIVISYDDLLSYESYFDSPIYFLHYLKQRKRAIDIPQIAVNDELDHLGMYIEHNIYSITASEFPVESRTHFGGYREKLDNYFCRLYHPSICIPKPTQDIPKEISDIIILLEKQISKGAILFAHFLLDMSSEAKVEFCQAIATALSREAELGRNIAMFAAGEFKYCLFVDIPGIEIMSNLDRQDYVLSAVLRDKSMPIMWINLKYDNYKNLINAEGKQCCYADIPEDDIERLNILSDQYAKSRIEYFQRQNHKKIGRNDPCPCGSGKKYKKCCLYRFKVQFTRDYTG